MQPENVSQRSSEETREVAAMPKEGSHKDGLASRRSMFNMWAVKGHDFSISDDNSVLHKRASESV